MKKINNIDFAYSLYVDEYNKYGEQELNAVADVLKSGRLFYPIGSQVKKLELRLKEEFDVADCSLVSSGTAAVHTALGAVGVDFGDEVITTPIADTGTVIPIFLQGAIPVFADVNQHSMMISAESIKPVISEKTRAIVVVHYGGFPADIDPIIKLGRDHGISIIEDCAQAPLAYYRGKRIGTIGDCASFSTNDTKHVSCGDGGFVISKNPIIAERARLFHDKGFDRFSGRRDPEIAAPNYRMTELQAAVLSKQWDKLEERVSKRRKFAEEIEKILESVTWLTAFKAVKENSNSYFSYLFSVDKSAPCTRNELCNRLCEAGIPARKGNLYDVLYKLKIFGGALPRYMKGLKHPDYRKGLCPIAEKANTNTIRLEMLEIFGEEEVERFRRVIWNYAK
jgi:perosamine synthetase